MGIFQEYLDHDSNVFEDKKVLQISYVPTNGDIERIRGKGLKYEFDTPLPYRDAEINSIANALGPAFRGDGPDNILLFGLPGTGKTATIRHLGREIEVASRESEYDVNYLMLNCATVNTEYGVLSNIGNSFSENSIPFTGWPMQKVYETTVELLDEKPQTTILVLDEIDKLLYKDVEKGNSILYQIMEMNTAFEKDSHVSLIGISNDTGITNVFDPRVESRFGGEKITFKNYDANQLRGILGSRTSLAFKDGTLEESVVPLCSALATQRGGDARYALNLLRVSGELAEREGTRRVTDKHVRSANEKISRDVIKDAIRGLPIQTRYALFSVYDTLKSGTTDTGKAYHTYESLVEKKACNQLTQRRFTDLVNKDLKELGIVNTRPISRGRYGRTSIISIDNETSEIVKKMREEIESR